MFHTVFHFGQRYANSKVVSKVVRIMLRLIWHCDIPLSPYIDRTVWFCHSGFDIVINKNTIIRSGGVIQHGVTLGEKDDSHESPFIEENVYIGAKAMVLGNVHIGKNCKIGAGALVMCDMPDDSTAVGVPARIIYHNIGGQDGT